MKLPTFGAIFCFARERAKDEGLDHELLFGVNSEAVLALSHPQRSIISYHLLAEILECEREVNQVSLQIKHRRRTFLFRSEEDAFLVMDLITKYREFQRLRRKEKFVGQDLLSTGHGQNLTPILSFKSVDNSTILLSPRREKKVVAIDQR